MKGNLMKIRDIPEDNRPRERLEKLGASVLSDAEIIALIIQTGSRNESAIDVANNIISKFGIAKLSNISLKELQSIKGIGRAKAIQLISAIELSKRLKENKGRNVHIQFAYQVYKHLESMSSLEQEHFKILMLNTKNRIIKEEIISIGLLDTTLIHPREVFKNAIRECASSIIIVHNHPSGDPEPSKADLEITNDLVRAGEIIDIEVLDHVIIGKGRYWSWKEDGQINHKL
jgi:DNA repair protein RadC